MKQHNLSQQLQELIDKNNKVCRLVSCKIEQNANQIVQALLPVVIKPNEYRFQK